MLRRLLPILFIALLVPAHADAAKRLTCKSGHTAWAQPGARIFWTTHKYEEGTFRIYYLCSRSIKHPSRFYDDQYADLALGPWRSYGRYVSFVVEWEDGAAAGWDAFWVDLATGEVRGNRVVGDTAIFAGDPQALAVDRDGSIAFLAKGENDQSIVGWLSDGVYKLAAAQTLATVDGPVDPASLTFSDGLIAWTTTAGVPGSVRAR